MRGGGLWGRGGRHGAGRRSGDGWPFGGVGVEKGQPRMFYWIVKHAINKTTQ